MKKLKFKVLKPITVDGTDYAIDAVVELSDETAIAALIAEGAIAPYEEQTPPADDDTRSAAAPVVTPAPVPTSATRARQVVAIRSIADDTRVTEPINRSRVVTAMVRAHQTRAASDYSTTELTDILGLIGGGNVLFPLSSRIPTRGNLNIVYADWTQGNPALGLVAECVKDENEVDLAHYIAIPGKYKATVAICSEYLEDNASMDAFVRAALSRAAGIGIDVGMLTGAFTNSIGLRGIIGDTTRVNSSEVGDTSTAVTRAQLDALIASVYAETYQSMNIAFNPLAWNAFVASLNPTNICCDQIQTGKNPTYRGWPVLLTSAVPAANKVVVGDFSHYTVGVARTVTVESDKSAGFAEDAVLFRVTCRLAGGVAGSKDANGYAFFAHGEHTAG